MRTCSGESGRVLTRLLMIRMASSHRPKNRRSRNAAIQRIERINYIILYSYDYQLFLYLNIN